MQPIATRSAGDDASASKVRFRLRQTLSFRKTLSLLAASMCFCQKKNSESRGRRSLPPDVLLRLPSKLNAAIKKHLLLRVRDRKLVQVTSATADSQTCGEAARTHRHPGPYALEWLHGARPRPPVTSADQRRVNLPSGEPTGDRRDGSLCWNARHRVRRQVRQREGG